MGSLWVVAAVLVALVGVILHSVPLLLVGALVVVLSLVSKWWAKYCLVRVEYQHALSATRAFPGEEVQLVTQLTNGKVLPLPWIQVTDELPREVQPLQGRTIPSPDPTRIVLTSLLSMKWYQRTTRTYTLRCLQRGHYFIGPVCIRSGDLFGMFSSELRKERDQFLTVYPRILPLGFQEPPSREPYGNIRVRRALIEDVTRPVGSRRYQASDSLKYVHWKATARTGELQTRVFDYSTSLNVALFFGVRTMEPPLQGIRPQLLEMGILTVTALANYALERGHPVGVYVNQTSRYTSPTMHVAPGRHPEQLTRILELMARVHPGESLSLSNLVLDQGRNLPWETTIIVVTAIPDDATLSALARLRRAGRAVALVHVGGDRGKPAPGGIPKYVVPNTLDWRELQEIVIQ